MLGATPHLLPWPHAAGPHQAHVQHRRCPCLQSTVCPGHQWPACIDAAANNRQHSVRKTRQHFCVLLAGGQPPGATQSADQFGCRAARLMQAQGLRGLHGPCHLLPRCLEPGTQAVPAEHDLCATVGTLCQLAVDDVPLSIHNGLVLGGVIQPHLHTCTHTGTVTHWQTPTHTHTHTSWQTRTRAHATKPRASPTVGSSSQHS